MSQKLRILLWVITVYLAVLGALFLFAPSVVATIMNVKELPDKVLNLMYGQVVLTFAYVGYMAATGGESRLSRALLALTTGHVLVFGYLLATAMQTFAQVGPPLIINLIFTGLLFWWRK